MNSVEAKSAGGLRKNPYLPPCRVCNSPASGLHYGVNSCEACKGFFKRSISRKCPYSVCTYDGNCGIQLDARNSCAICRYNKCLRVGMSKSAIKTGRYSHKKRTSDTLEIQSACYSQVKANTLTMGTESTDVNSNWFAPDVDGESLLQTIRKVMEAFRRNFSNTTYMCENTSAVTSMVEGLLKEKGVTQVTEILATENGLDTEAGESPTLWAEAVLSDSMGTLNSSTSQEFLMHTADCQEAARKRVFNGWCISMEQFVTNMVQFVKHIPGFSSLSATDQIVLIKAVRPEIAMVVKFKNFAVGSKYDAFVQYQGDAPLVVIPNRILRQMFFHGAEKYNMEFDHMLRRFVQKMEALNLGVEQLALLSAISLFSPDRENLSASAVVKVQEQQQQLVSALQYSFCKSRPADKLAVSRSLMVLPLLRVINDFNTKAVNKTLQQSQQGLNPTIYEQFPLLEEMLNSHNVASSTDPASSHL